MHDQDDTNQLPAPPREQELLQADILYAAGIVLDARLKWSEAVPPFLQCAEIRRRHIPNHPDMGRVLYRLGTALFGMPDEDKEALLTEAQTIFENAGTESNLDLALVLYALAGNLDRKRQYDDRSAGERSELLHKAAKSLVQPGYEQVWNFKSELDKQNVHQALSFLDKTLGPDDPEVAHALLACARLTHYVGCSYDDAVVMEQMYSRALNIYTISFGPDHDLVAEVRSRLGFTCHHLYRNDEAQVHYQDALRILLKIHGPSTETLEVLHSMKGLWEEGSEPDKIVADLQTTLCPVKDEVKAAARAIADFLRRAPKEETSDPVAIAMRARLPYAFPPRHLKILDDDVIETFQHSLERDITRSMDRLPYYLGIGHHSDPLKRALGESAVDNVTQRLPSTLDIWIDLGKSKIRVGDETEGTVTRQIYPVPGE